MPILKIEDRGCDKKKRDKKVKQAKKKKKKGKDAVDQTNPEELLMPWKKKHLEEDKAAQENLPPDSYQYLS